VEVRSNVCKASLKGEDAPASPRAQRRPPAGVLALGLLVCLTSVPVAFERVDAQEASLLSAVLPGSRTVQVGRTATAFATIINVGTATASDCGIAPTTPVPASFSFQTTDPATNAPTGNPNSPVPISPGAAQSFVIAFTPTADIAPTDVALAFTCSNTSPAPVVTGLNTLLLSATTLPSPDIIALGATPTNDGIVTIPGPPGTAAFSVATSNVGASSQVTVTADTGSAIIPVLLTICQTNPLTAACLSPPSATVATFVDVGATPTFAVFLNALAGTVFDPAKSRVFIRFRDLAGASRGATSVAARTASPGGEKIYIGYYAEDAGNNPEDPTIGSLLVRLPSGDGGFAGQMPFTYLGCTGSRSIGLITGSRSSGSLAGSWGGPVDGTMVGGTFAGSADVLTDIIAGTYTNASGKLRISVGLCHYYVAAFGTWKAFGSLTSLPPSFVAQATAGAMPIMAWPSLGSGTVYAVRVFDENCLKTNPSAEACFMGEAFTLDLTAHYPLSFPGATALAVDGSYLILVTGATASGDFLGFSSVRLQL
jgi:hypothetical protein